VWGRVRVRPLRGAFCPIYISASHLTLKGAMCVGMRTAEKEKKEKNNEIYYGLRVHILRERF